ncbi:MAG: cytochrome C oxidase subunit I [Burkholderiales bacterium]|nr:cytochrome C oxidase subunit I [Burkholderiales bacterium]
MLDRGRIKLLLIALICAAPTVAAYLVYYFWQPQARVNYGELIEPRPLPEGILGGGQTPISELKGKWVMMTVDSGACDAYCREKLYTLRQVRLTQGREMARIARVWLIDDNRQPETALLADYDGTTRLHPSSRVLQQAFPAEASRRDHIYLIDPLGNLMMRYPKNADPGKIVKDLARLLKVSRIG